MYFPVKLARFLRTPCMAPFVEHLRNERKYIKKLQKEKDQMTFCRWFLFVIPGVKFKHFEYVCK